MISSRVKKEVLSQIKPSKKQDTTIKKTVSHFVYILESIAQKKGFDVDFYVGGSFGKGTYLKDTFDVDIFCRFSQNYGDDKLSDMLEEILNVESIEYRREKGSRDYFSGTFYSNSSSIVFELVPTKRISTVEEGVNSTDYSYLHVEYVTKSIENNPQLSDEIRLAKALFKAKDFYGAESYIGGFSGHVIDLLIIYYGSLENLLLDAKQWGDRIIIDVAHHFSSQQEIINTIEHSKLSSLVVVDSILPNRNAAKALLEEKYGEFLIWAYQLEELQIDDFKKEKKSLQQQLRNHREYADKNNLYFIAYKLQCDNIKSYDIAGAKIKKLYEKLNTRFENYDFSVFFSNFYISEDFSQALFVYYLSVSSLPITKWLKGPPIEMKQHLTEVLQKAQFYKIKHGVVWYVIKRDITTIEEISSINVELCQKEMNNSLDFLVDISHW